MSEAHEVGPLAEEAAKLLGALSGWASEHVAEAGDGLSGLADRVESVVHGVDEHLATDAAECTACPLCRTVHAVRQVDPEVKAHLASAGSSLVRAVNALLATPASRAQDTDFVEHIALDDEGPDEPTERSF